MTSTRYFDVLATQPNQVLDAVLKQLQLKNDAALSRALQVAPPVISKIRNGVIPLGPTILVRALAATDVHIRDLHSLVTSIPKPRPAKRKATGQTKSKRRSTEPAN